MPNFVQHLLGRHAQPDYAVQPRVRSRFEPLSLTDTGLGFADEPAEDVPAHAANLLARQPGPPVNSLSTELSKPLDKQPIVPSGSAPIFGEVAPAKRPAGSPANIPDWRMAERRVEPTLGTLATETDNVPAKETTSPISQATVQPSPNLTRFGVVEPVIPPTKGGEPLQGESQPVRSGRSEGIFSDSRSDQSAAVPPVGTSPSPTIQVTIGRIEVRAIMPNTPPKSAPSPGPKPRLSLEEYLKQRNRTS